MTRVEERERVIVRFAGDSGDGMQLAGGRFTDATAALGNDLATLPNFPAEIRAPAGTLAGVSAFQIHFAARDILTPGDKPTTLVAMNPAALRSNIAELEPGGTLIVNEEAFTVRNLQKAGYTTNPLEDESLERYQLKRIPMLSLTQRAVEGMEGVGSRDAQRARNLFALGLVCWLYDRPTEVVEEWIEAKFEARPAVMEANRAAFRAGYAFGDTTEQIDVRYHVAPATDIAPGTYRTINGNTAIALGLIAAAQRAGLQLMLSSYPITPASELLHELARYARHGVRTVQAEDEIAAAGIALGAAFGGALGVTATSGPGMDLKAETIGLAAALELPMIVIDVQRAGPSTGMPTKTEQSDLLMALHGRHGESPLPIVASATPGDCFDTVYEAARIAIRYRTPVIVLSDLFLGQLERAVARPGDGRPAADRPGLRDAAARGRPVPPVRAQRRRGAPVGGARHARPRAPHRRPGEAGRHGEHLLRGVQPRDDDGGPPGQGRRHRGAAAGGRRRRGRRAAGDRLGSSYGVMGAAARRIRNGGRKVAIAHLRHLNPLPANTGEVLRNFPRVLA